MRIAGIVGTAILYIAIVSFAVLLLPEVQRRSAGGAAFDTWKLNFDENERQASAQKAALNKTMGERDKNMEQLVFTSHCIRLFDENGLPRTALIPGEL